MKQCKIKFCFISGMQFLTVIRKPFDFMDMVWPNSNLNYTRMPSYDEYCVIAPLEKIFFRQLETSINFLMTTKVVMQTFESLLLRKWTNTLLSTTGNHCLNQGEGGGGSCVELIWILNSIFTIHCISLNDCIAYKQVFKRPTLIGVK